MDLLRLSFLTPKIEIFARRMISPTRSDGVVWLGRLADFFAFPPCLGFSFQLGPFLDE